jgi:hypothetical protein
MLGGVSRSTPNGNRNEPRSLCASSPLTALPKAEKTNRSPGLGRQPGTEQSASRIAASKEGVPAMFGGVVSFDLINAFATN